MKAPLITSFFIVSLIAAGPGIAEGAAGGRVTIRVDGIQQLQGQAVFVLMDSAASHTGDGPVYSKTIQPIDNSYSIAEFELPAGEYSAVVYHDINANGKLDRWFYGKPKEPYGFSNNARNAFGIPGFEESRFVVGSKNTQLRITLE